MSAFLQSPEWEEVQRRVGRPTLRLAGVLVIQHDLPFGFRYLYAPRPAVLPSEFFAVIRERAGRSGAIFVKVDTAAAGAAVPPGCPAIRSHSIQPRTTVAVDCRPEEAAILSLMRPKTRYNIRLAERHGVSVRRLAPEEIRAALGAFLRLAAETARREGFSPHPAAHYRTLLEVRSDRFSNELWVAELGGRVLAAAIVNWYAPASTATYLHGASSRERREVMAPHLLHWGLIREARRRGYGFYDLGGIDEQRWPGLTRFKLGFGGSVQEYPESFDVVFRPRWYRLYRFWRGLSR